MPNLEPIHPRNDAYLSENCLVRNYLSHCALNKILFVFASDTKTRRKPESQPIDHSFHNCSFYQSTANYSACLMFAVGVLLSALGPGFRLMVPGPMGGRGGGLGGPDDPPPDRGWGGPPDDPPLTVCSTVPFNLCMAARDGFWSTVYFRKRRGNYGNKCRNCSVPATIYSWEFDIILTNPQKFLLE